LINISRDIKSNTNQETIKYLQKENIYYKEELLYSCKNCLEPFCFESDVVTQNNFESLIENNTYFNNIYIFSTKLFNKENNFYSKKFKFENIKKSNNFEIKCNKCLQKIGNVKLDKKTYIGRLDFENLKISMIPKQKPKTNKGKIDFHFEDILEKSETYKETILEINKFKEIIKNSKEIDFQELFEKLKNKNVEIFDIKNKLERLELQLDKI